MATEWQTNAIDLHKDLIALISLPLIVIGIVLGSLTATRLAFPNLLFLIALASIALGLVTLLLSGQYTTLARHLLAWGVNGLLLTALGISSEPWLPMIGLPIIVINTALVTGGGLVSAVVIGALTWWLARDNTRTYPMVLIAGLYALTAFIAMAVVAVFGRTLRLAWETEAQTDQMLIEARERQGNLASVLKSLELTTSLLEQANRKLYLAHRQAEEAQRLKEQFAANVSHELRTPLNLILGFSEMLYLSPEVYGDMRWPPTLRRDVYQIYRSSRHLLEMIDDILDLSRYDLAEFTLNKEPTKIEPLLQNAVEITAGLFRDRPVNLELVVEPNLPALNLDRTRIRQVVLNLLSNARHFTEHGTVRVQAHQSNGDVIVSVSDTGPGIPADKLSHIFEEFYQVDGSLRRNHHGAGLGLAISKHFVQAHEGRIWVESEEGHGSTFYFSLPIPHTGTPTLYPKSTNSLEPAHRDERTRLLVIDPDPTVAALLQRHLGNCDVFQVEDVPHLEEEIIARQPHLILNNIPPTHPSPQQEETRWGSGALLALEQKGLLTMPVVSCSLPSKAWLASELSVTACLSKPITAQQLYKELNRIGPVHEILIVDDDRGFCQLVERMLGMPGTYHVRHAYDGQEGLQAIQQQPPDLVLLDLIMPNMDGFEMLVHKNHTPALAAIPVILLSVTSAAEDALLRQGSGFSIQRTTGLRLVEVLRCLHGAVDAFGEIPHVIANAQPPQEQVTANPDNKINAV
ncbi:MAG: ATP-binding protein [Chloroflexi bacterium]|nr:ATP-binding protein [Chloroflexota bacterium]